MAEKHPDELQLLSFVEEELDGSARHEVAEHLVACRACTDQVRRLEAARDALRAAPLLELPDARRSEIVAALPERRDPWRRLRPARRILAVAAPVAAAAGVVAVLVLAGPQLRGGDNEEAAGDAQEAATDASGGAAADEAAPQAAVPGAVFVRFTEGPAEEVVRLLAAAEISAEIDSTGAVVADARAGEVRRALSRQVRRALADRPAGDVAVYVR
jgi:anti-sigma factor RsiW